MTIASIKKVSKITGIVLSGYMAVVTIANLCGAFHSYIVLALAEGPAIFLTYLWVRRNPFNMTDEQIIEFFDAEK